MRLKFATQTIPLFSLLPYVPYHEIMHIVMRPLPVLFLGYNMLLFTVYSDEYVDAGAPRLFL
jgi:hypothetical protein